MSVPIDRAAAVPSRPWMSGGLASQLSAYTIVSAIALGLDFSVFLSLVHGLAMRASLAGVVGYAAGLIVHFILSSRFVFDVRHLDKSQPRLFVEFVASGIVGLVITGVVIAIAADLAGFAPIIAKGAAVVISFITVFALRRGLVFAARAGG